MGPIVVGNVVIVSIPEGRIEARNASTGTEVWRFDTSTGLSVPPALAGDRVLITDDAGASFAVDLRNGGLEWTLQGSGAPIGPALANGEIAVIATSAELKALNISDGEKQWSFVGSPAVPVGIWHDGLVLTNGSKLLIKRLQNGEDIRDTEIGYAARDGGTISGDTAYLAGPQLQITAVNLANGTVLWHADPTDYFAFGGLTATPSAVYFVGQNSSGSGTLTALDAATGSRLWSLSQAWSGPMSTDGSTGYVPSLSGITGIDLASGKTIGRTSIAPPMLTELAIASGTGFGLTQGGIGSLEVFAVPLPHDAQKTPTPGLLWVLSGIALAHLLSLREKTPDHRKQRKRS